MISGKARTEKIPKHGLENSIKCCREISNVKSEIRGEDL